MLKHFISRKVSTDSALSYFFFAFITMAGLSYINFMPGVVNALAGGIGFSDVEAGQIIALNGYGALVGSIVAIFLVRKIDWKRALLTFLVLLTVMDLGTVSVDDYSVMLGWRFLAGVFGGLCVGIAFSVLARLKNPERAFGSLLFVQFSIGSLVMYLLPLLETQFDSYTVFYVMAGFVLLSLVLLPFLPVLPRDNKASKQTMSLSAGGGNALLLMLVIMFYQCGASAIYAYVGLIGLEAEFAAESVNTYIATTGLLGLLGAMLPMISGNRFGRLYWIVAGVALSGAAAVMLSVSPLTPLLYIAAMALLFFSWTAVISYLLAVTAEMDSSGRLSTIAAVVSSVGMATGPLLASSLLDNGDFSVMLYTCAVIFLVSFFLLFKPVRAQEKEQDVALSSQYQT